MKWSLAADFIIHDLAADGCELIGGSFMPAGPQVQFEVDAAYASLGNSRAALLLYVGHPEVAEDRVYDSGGQPTPGTQWFSVGSIGGDSPWASTTHRKVSVDVDPTKRVTWQVLAAIIGGTEQIPVADSPRDIAITPDGTKAFVTSLVTPVVTPISLGRPGSAYTRDLYGNDRVLEAISMPHPATCIAATNSHLLVGVPGSVWILSVLSHEPLACVELAGAVPTYVSPIADGSFAVAVTQEGRAIRIGLPDFSVSAAETGGPLAAAAVALDGTSAFIAQTSGLAGRVKVPGFEVEETVELDGYPSRLSVAPDGKLWALCRVEGANGRLKLLNPVDMKVRADYELPFPNPLDMAIVPVEGQTSKTVRTAWVVFEQSRYCEFNIGGAFAGTPHSFHTASFSEAPNDAVGVAVNDYGEIWVVQSGLNRVFKWIGGRVMCRARRKGSNEIFFGEYLDVNVIGAQE